MGAFRHALVWWGPGERGRLEVNRRLLEAASNAGGASGKSGAGYGFSLVWPLGSKFADAMLMQSCGSVCVPVGGVIPWWRQPPCQRSGGVLCITHSRRDLCRVICKVSICSRVMN
jgi:hypothetical protein